jgi:hypothetical protein
MHEPASTLQIALPPPQSADVAQSAQSGALLAATVPQNGEQVLVLTPQPSGAGQSELTQHEPQFPLRLLQPGLPWAHWDGE